MIEIDVDNRIRIAGLDPEAADAIKKAFTHKNPKRAAMEARRQSGWWSEPLMYPSWGEEGGRLTLPRGGMEELREILRARSLSYGTRDRRAQGEIVAWEPPARPLWPHQERIVEACLRRENCVIVSATASGKTSALLGLLPRINRTTLVIVHTNALAVQWAERAEAELRIPYESIGLLGGGKRKIGPLTIGTVKSVTSARLADPTFAARWGAVFADEVHLFAAKTFYDCVDPFPSRYRIGVSDEWKRKDRKEFLIKDLFGRVEEQISYEEMIQAGHVMDVEVMVVPTDFRADWYRTTGEGEDRSPDYSRLLAEMEADEARNAIVENLLKSELAQGRQCIAFGRAREHCRLIGSRVARVARAGYLIGGAGADRQEFDRTRKGLKTGKLRAAVGTIQACGTGVDLPGVEVGVSAVPILSNRTSFRQARGRVCRRPEGKTVARLYVLWDRNVFGMSHVKNAAAWNASTKIYDGERWIPAKDWLRAQRLAT